MKRSIRAIVFLMVLLFNIPQTVFAAQLLIPGGQLVGLELSNDAVTVAAFDDSCGAAARDAGLQIGDQILAVDDQTVSSAADVRKAMENCGSQVALTVLRGSKRMTLRLCPAATKEGKFNIVVTNCALTGNGGRFFFFGTKKKANGHTKVVSDFSKSFSCRGGAGLLPFCSYRIA